ncbi:MAG: TerC family protein [Alphaproteobacteria bacterium]|nr:MAG: TerC family protein [Alphaproteobacteria bacterium]
MLDLLTDPAAWVALATLTALEIVLGVDNIVFISVLVSRCSPRDAKRARQIGLALAFVFRIVLLLGLTWLMRLTYPVVTVLDRSFSWHDIILIAGGLFLIAKATHEIHAEVEGEEVQGTEAKAYAAFSMIVAQIVVVDIVFSIDSIVTAIGMAQDIEIMIAAIVIAMIVMYAASGPIARFIAEHPTTKMLALAFLVMIGLALVADGFAFHIPRGYIYASMAFAGAVEVFNVLARRNRVRNAARTKRQGMRERHQ